MKTVIFGFIIWHITVPLLGAQSSIHEILLSSLRDSNYLKNKELVDTRKNLPQTLRWLDKIELRTQTDEFFFTQEQYSLRFLGTRPSEIKLAKGLNQLQLIYQERLAEYMAHKVLATNYQFLVESILLNDEKNILQAYLLFQDKKNKYLESLFTHQLDTDIKDMVQSYRKINTTHSKQKELEQKQKALMEKYHQTYNESEINKSSWIGMQEILSVIEKVDDASIPMTDKYAKALYDQEKNMLETKQINQSKWDLFDFAQARWQNRPNDQLFREKFAIGAGFRLPYAGDQKKNKNEKLFESFTNQFDISLAEQEYTQKIQLSKLKIKNLIAEWQHENENIEKFKSKFDATTLSQSPLVSPQDLLYIEESILEWQETILKRKVEIYNEYIKLLDISHTISQRPLKNYLVAGIPTIE